MMLENTFHCLFLAFIGVTLDSTRSAWKCGLTVDCVGEFVGITAGVVVTSIMWNSVGSNEG